MGLIDILIELRRELGYAGLLPTRHCDHDIVRLEGAVVGGELETIPPTCQPFHPDAIPYRKLEVLGVALEKVCELVLGGEPPAGIGVGHPGETIEPVRGEKPEGIPPVTPRIPDPFVGIEDQEPRAALGEMVSHRQPGLTAAYNDGL